MNNLDFKMKSIYHRNPETTLMLNGIQYTLYWTPHARERIISRLKSSLMLQNTYILDFINDLSNYDKNILKQDYLQLSMFIKIKYELLLVEMLIIYIHMLIILQFNEI